MRFVLLVLLGFPFGFSSAFAEPPPPAATPTAEPSYEPTYRERTTVTALYRVEPVAGGKGFQGVFLVLDSGETWIRSYRPMRAELKFAGKRVVATGRPYENSPYVQSVQGTHFALESVKLAPGETPHDPEPTEILAPPLARTAEQAKAQDGWFAQCVGTVKDGVFTFADGGSMPVDLPTGFFPITEIEGQQTLLAWVGEGGLHGRGNCAGLVPRCGMTEIGADR